MAFRPERRHNAPSPCAATETSRKGNLGDVKPVGSGVCEMREFFGSGWRMYYTECNNTLVVMLGGGDKSTQSADIARAIALAETLQIDDEED